MFCKKCGNEINEDEKFCDKCSSHIKIENNTTMENINDKRHKKVKSKYLIIGIIIILTIFIGAILVYSLTQNTIPEYIATIDGQMVLNINADEFREKLRKDLKESTGINIIDSNIDGKWLQAYKGESNSYYGSIYFSEQFRVNLISIEEYQGKIKSITWLYSTDSATSIISDEIVSKYLKEIGIEYKDEKAKKQVEKYFDITTYTKANAVENRGFFDIPFASSGSEDIIVQQYRKNFSLPYPYDKPERRKLYSFKM